MSNNDKIEVTCDNCKSKSKITKLSFRRYQLRNDTDKYICLTCKNRDKSRYPVTDAIKKQRAEIARKLWKEEEYRKKVISGLQRVVKSPAEEKAITQIKKEEERKEKPRRIDIDRSS